VAEEVSALLNEVVRAVDYFYRNVDMKKPEPRSLESRTHLQEPPHPAQLPRQKPMATLAAAVVEVEVVTETTRLVNSTLANPIIVVLMLHVECRICRARGASCSTRITHQSPSKYHKNGSRNFRHPEEAQLPVTGSSKRNRRHQFEHLRGRMEVAEEVSALLNEVVRAVDYFYRQASPSASNLSSQLYHCLVCGCLLSNVANNLAIRCKCKSI
jgi:hypothetical protein